MEVADIPCGASGLKLSCTEEELISVHSVPKIKFYEVTAVNKTVVSACWEKSSGCKPMCDFRML